MKRKGDLEDWIVPMGLVIISIMIVMFVLKASSGTARYDKKEFTKVATNRIARNLEMLDSYHGEASIEIEFPVEYSVKIMEKFVTVTYKKDSTHSIFYINSKIKGTFDEEVSSLCMKKTISSTKSKDEEKYIIEISDGDEAPCSI